MSEPTPPSRREVPELVPARMLNEYAYCPRLMYLEWVQGDFADNADTIEGRYRHRRVDGTEGRLDPDRHERVHARSVELSATRIGLIAKIDLVEAEGTIASPVDYKRGRPPANRERSWEPERVQICAQALILEENGYSCSEGFLYFVESRERVRIPIDDALRARTLVVLTEAREAAAAPDIPPPLADSPKCPRCSLVSICLPDETNALRACATEAATPRRLMPARDDALPLYVQTPGARIGKRGEELVVTDRDGHESFAKIAFTSHVGLFGSVQLSSQAVHELAAREIPVVHYSHSGWLRAITVAMPHKNIELRQRQFAAFADDDRSLVLSRRVVMAKIRNARTLLRRNGEAVDPTILGRLKELAEVAESSASAESLLGIEGTAARIYFGAFSRMIKRTAGSGDWTFELDGRNRRPPRDPVNALLSLAYALLVKDWVAVLLTVGFDPYLGFYHRPRYGRPALALDLMEEFRPLIAESVVLSAINTGAVGAGHFVRRSAGVALTTVGRSAFIEAYERRMADEITHPLFKYRISYRRIFEVQARLLARHLAGEIPDFPPFLTR